MIFPSDFLEMPIRFPDFLDFLYLLNDYCRTENCPKHLETCCSLHPLLSQSLHDHRLFPDSWWSGAAKSRQSPRAVVVWMYCCRQQQHWKCHLSSSPINTNNVDKVHALISGESAYWGNYIRNNQGRPETCRRSSQINNLASRAGQ